MKEQGLRYQTAQPVSECIRKILESPREYACKWGTPLWYDAEMVGPSKMLVTFRGGQFRKMMRTQYWVEFTSEPSCTAITLYFRSELFGLPPMTPISDIDLFMEQKTAAVRCDNG